MNGPGVKRLEISKFCELVDDWLARARLSCDPATDRALLAELRGFLDIAPERVSLILDTIPDVDAFEELLAIGALESASRRLIGSSGLGLMCSRSPDGDHMASIWLPGAVKETQFWAGCEALAFGGALALAMKELATKQVH